MARIYDNPLFIIFCCGGLPFLGLLKSLVVVIPVVMMHVVSCFFISIIMLPHDIWFTYYTVLKTAMIGRIFDHLVV
jgi:hypothetical protein